VKQRVTKNSDAAIITTAHTIDEEKRIAALPDNSHHQVRRRTDH